MINEEKFIKAAELAAMWEDYMMSDYGKPNSQTSASLVSYREFYGSLPDDVRELYLDSFDAFKIEVYGTGLIWSVPEVASALMSEAYAE
jgi:hypothetical protein